MLITIKIEIYVYNTEIMSVAELEYSDKKNQMWRSNTMEDDDMGPVSGE